VEGVGYTFGCYHCIPSFLPLFIDSEYCPVHCSVSVSNDKIGARCL